MPDAAGIGKNAPNPPAARGVALGTACAAVGAGAGEADCANELDASNSAAPKMPVTPTTRRRTDMASYSAVGDPAPGVQGTPRHIFTRPSSIDEVVRKHGHVRNDPGTDRRLPAV